MWTDFSLCNRVCGNGNYTRTRLCDSPENKHGGKPCPGSDTDDLEECNVEPCPGNIHFFVCFFKITLREKQPEFGVFLLRISPYSAQTRGNTDQRKLQCSVSDLK